MTPTTLDAVKLLQRGTIAFAKMESSGIRIDTNYLDQAICDLRARIEIMRDALRVSDVWKLWKGRFGDRANMRSRVQLGEVLFKEMCLHSVGKKTRTGRDRTNVEVLEALDIPFLKQFIRIEQLEKVLKTYLIGIKEETCDGFLHCSFDLNTAASYRSSCSRINFQNQLVRDKELGTIVRQCYIPRSDKHCLVEVDFSQIEVRVGAAYHKDPTMMEYLNDSSKDMHRDSAMGIYLIDDWNTVPEEHRKAVRYLGKNGFVFPAFYGQVYFQLTVALWDGMEGLKGPGGVSMRKHLRSKGIEERGLCDAKQRPKPHTFEAHVHWFEQNFWGYRFKAYDAWKKKWWQRYVERGWFRNLTGFRFQWGKEGLMKRNDATNYPIQSAAFHCLLWSIIRLQKWIDNTGSKALIVGQIHDCVVLDCPVKEVRRVLDVCKQVMTVELPMAWPWINVPLETEADVTPPGASWDRKQPWVQKDGRWEPK